MKIILIWDICLFPFQFVFQGGYELQMGGAPQFEDTTSDDDDEDYVPSRVNICRVSQKRLHEHFVQS
jgi:hypothetical protein